MRMNIQVAGVLLAVAVPALAQDWPLTPIDAQAETTNGTVWTLNTAAFDLSSARFNSGLERRGVLECPLGAVPAIATLRAARLEFEIASLTSSGESFPIIEFHGYPGNGVLEIADATRPSNPIGLSGPITGLGEWPPVYLDAQYVASLLGSASHLGIYTRQFIEGRQVAFYSTEAADVIPVSEPRLVLELAAPVAHGGVMFMQNRRDYVWDPHRKLMYITMADGSVERFDPATRRLIFSWRVGESLLGADITADGQFLYAADVPDESSRPQVRKVDLDTGSVSTLTFEPAFSEGRVWDIKFGPNGKGLVTTAYDGSGWVPLRELDSDTDSFAIRPDAMGSGFNEEITGKSRLWRSADRSTIYVIEGAISSRPLIVYDTASDAFVEQRNANNGSNGIGAASPNGGALARMVGSTTEIRNRSLDVVGVIGSQGSPASGGVVFDPVRPLLYVCDASNDRVIAFHVDSRVERFRFPVGENLFAIFEFEDGTLAVGGDGTFLLASTPFGIRYFELFFLSRSLVDEMVDCFDGPGLGPSPSQGLPGDCLRRFDGDADADVDLADVAALMRTFDPVN